MLLIQTNDYHWEHKHLKFVFLLLWRLYFKILNHKYSCGPKKKSELNQKDNWSENVFTFFYKLGIWVWLKLTTLVRTMSLKLSFSSFLFSGSSLNRICWYSSKVDYVVFFPYYVRHRLYCWQESTLYFLVFRLDV